MTWLDFNSVNFFGMRLFSLVFILGAYLLGSISFGILVCKSFGLPDPRTTGSGNPGATNVLRSGKKVAAVLTLLGDVLKGYVAVWLALRSGLLMWEVCAVAIAVFLGHLYPVYYRFKGGKGVATALGVMLAVSVWLGVAALLTWALVFWATRYSSAAAIAASALAPIFGYFLMPGYVDYVWMTLVLSVFLIWRHRSNIKKLLAGTEAGFGKKT